MNLHAELARAHIDDLLRDADGSRAIRGCRRYDKAARRRLPRSLTGHPSPAAR